MSDAENWGVLIYRINEQAAQIKMLQNHVEQLELNVIARDKERAAAERNYLVAGISFLGGTIMLLGALIWSYRSIIFRGLP